jgi:hypothetical protein
MHISGLPVWRRHLLRWQFLCTAAAFIVAIVSSTLSFASVDPIQQIQNELIAAKSQTTIPSNVDPPLASWSSNVGKYFSYSSTSKGRTCFADFSVVKVNLNKCVYGASATKRTIVLAGDSQAFQWLPALSKWAKLANYKVVVVTKVDCRIWPLSIYLLGDHTSPYPQCPIWRKWAIAQILALRPAAVVIAGETSVLSATQLESTSQIVSEVSVLAKELAPAKTHLIMMQNIPWFWGLPASPACLVIHLQSVNSCGQRRSQELNEWNVIQTGMYSAVIQAQSRGLTETLPVDNLVCSPDFCPTIAGSTLMYIDDAHLTRLWTLQVSAAYGEMLKPLL